MRLVDHHQTAGLLDALGHSVVVEGHQGPGVDDLGGDAPPGQLVGGLQGTLDIEQVGHDGHIGALPLDIRLAKGDAEVGIIRYLALGGVEHLMLEEADGVIVPDGGAQQARRISGGGGADHLQSGDVHEDALQRLGVGGGVAAAGALLAPDHQRDLGVAAEDVAGLGHLVEDLVSRHEGEVPVHQLGDWAHAGAGGAQGGANNGGLGNGGVADTLRTEFLIEISGAAIDAAQLFHVLAHDKDALIPAHLLGDGLTNRLRIRKLSHCLVPP